MSLLCIGLILLSIAIAAHYYILRRALYITTEQMEEIKKQPESNRQLKSFTTDPEIEGLLKNINDLYQSRQQERISFQRRETQIRREIENISHDLRTPLTSIMGYVNLIQDSNTKEEEKEEYLQIIYKRAKVLQGFIQDFYELSRIEAQDYPLLLDAVHVQSTLSETIVAYYNEFEKKQIQVEVDLSDRNCFIIADKIQFNRIVNNLIQNALKYSKSTFILRQFIYKDECIIQFKNDKEQMKEEELGLLFDRFYTGDLSRNNQSTGLGLTISKILVEKMKGSIMAKFEEDYFVIELRWKV